MASPFTPERRPLTIDVHNDEAVRRWLANKVAEQVTAHREPIPAIHLLLDGHEEVLEWNKVLAADPDADLAATWAFLGSRRDVQRRMLILRLEQTDAPDQACLIEEQWAAGEPVSWWMGHRPFTVENGIGTMLDSAWSQHEGQGRVPRPFRQLLTPAPGAAPVQLLPAKVREPQSSMVSGTLPDDAVLPNLPLIMAEQMRALVMGQLATEAFRHTEVFLIRGRTWERWRLGKTLPTAADDMVRWICGQRETPHTVAIAEAAVAVLDGKRERIIRIVAELGGGRAELAIIMGPRADDPDDVVPVRWMLRDLGPVPEGEAWIATAPVARELASGVPGEDPPE